MPASRPNLTLDEQSFQGLLSAAFIIQEHNDRKKQSRPAAAEAEGENRGADHLRPGDLRPGDLRPDDLRPGERLQRNWASMWLMSQERGLWPERSAEIRETRQADATQSNWIMEAEDEAEDFAADEFPLPASGDSFPDDALPDNPLASDPLAIEASSAEAADGGPISFSFLQRIVDWRVKVRFQRADLYLGTAIFVAVLALLWPAAGSPQPAALSPWERALITLGIAEAPAPVVHLQGDPGIEVWVDPHSALYYCPGEEQYGKTSGGRLSSQRDAQMDRFEPASRSACE